MKAGNAGGYSKLGGGGSAPLHKLREYGSTSYKFSSQGGVKDNLIYAKMVRPGRKRFLQGKLSGFGKSFVDQYCFW